MTCPVCRAPVTERQKMIQYQGRMTTVEMAVLTQREASYSDLLNSLFESRRLQRVHLD